MTAKEFEQHLDQEHRMSPFTTYLKEIVYGGIDGIVTTFAVVAGFSGAQHMGGNAAIPMLSVLLFGFANLFADATSMGLGNFLSVRADQDVYKKERRKERHEIEHNTDFEKAETQHMLVAKGFAPEQAEKLTSIYATNKDYWAEFMMKEELDMPNPLGDNPFFTAIATSLSFIIFGLIPLIPYIFLRGLFDNEFLISIIFTCTALVILALLRWKVTGRDFIKTFSETVLVGGISALVAYAVGTLFRI